MFFFVVVFFGSQKLLFRTEGESTEQEQIFRRRDIPVAQLVPPRLPPDLSLDPDWCE